MCEPRYSCILFDLDGTVLNTVSDCTTAINATMTRLSLPLHTPLEVQSYLNNGARMLIKRALPTEKQADEKLIDSALGIYLEEYSRACCESSVIYDGVTELLTRLSAMGVKLGIVTNKPDLQTRLVVPHYFGTLFDYYCGNSESYPTKPDPMRVKMALSSLKKTPEQTFFVGDSAVDVLTARNASIPCVGVSWGFGGAKGFGSNRPDAIVDNAIDIIRYVKHGF